MNRPLRSTSVVFTFAVAIVLLASQAYAQAETFSNASLEGTYAFSLLTAGADEPVQNLFNGGLIYFAGDGTYRAFFMITNRPGEPDEDGNPTRNSQRNISNPSTWTPGTGTYDVRPSGVFTFTLANTIDGLPQRTELIDGIRVIVEYELVSRGPMGATGGGLQYWRASRIADGDTLPAAPAD